MGDYIYEYGTGAYAAGENGVIRATVPTHEIITLADYRKRHAQYKTDADLKRLHALVPWITTWDDHESANNSWSGGAENHTPEKEGSWAARKAAAQTAYDEWMPVRLQGTAVVGDGGIHPVRGEGAMAVLVGEDLHLAEAFGFQADMAEEVDGAAGEATGLGVEDVDAHVPTVGRRR